MAYLVVVSYDLVNASSQTYQEVERELFDAGLKHNLVSNTNTTIVLPTTTVAGEFNGASAGKVRDDISTLVHNIFSRHNVRSKYFVAVGGDWAWGSNST